MRHNLCPCHSHTRTQACYAGCMFDICTSVQYRQALSMLLTQALKMNAILAAPSEFLGMGTASPSVVHCAGPKSRKQACSSLAVSLIEPPRTLLLLWGKAIDSLWCRAVVGVDHHNTYGGGFRSLWGWACASVGFLTCAHACMSVAGFLLL